MDLSKLNNRLEIDAHNYAEHFQSADERIKRIITNAYLSGEHKVADKVVDWCMIIMNDKDGTDVKFKQIETDIAKELFIHNCNVSNNCKECAEQSILAAFTFINELKNYYGK